MVHKLSLLNANINVFYITQITEIVKKNAPAPQKTGNCQLLMSHKRGSHVFTQPQNDPLKNWSNRSQFVLMPWSSYTHTHTHLTLSTLARTMRQRIYYLWFSTSCTKLLYCTPLKKTRLKEKQGHTTPWTHHSNSEDMKQWQNGIFYWRLGRSSKGMSR